MIPRPRGGTSFLGVFVAVAALFVAGCGGHSARTARMRTALDAGRPRDAIAALDHELGVKDGALPRKLEGDDALLVLDRAAIQQEVGAWESSKRDYQAADKTLDALDLAHGSGDDIARWVFSDSAGRYVAAPHEKVLLNVLNMLNYLETRDLTGARVEARRMLVTSRYLHDFRDGNEPSLGLGSFVAGFVFEKSGDVSEAERFYGDAARIDADLREAAPFEPDVDGDSEILVVVGDGRVPHRIAEHVPIGLALTRASPALAAGDRERAQKLAAQGLVTWVNFPSLAPSRPLGPLPTLTIDGRAIPLEEALDVDHEVREQWRAIEGDVMAAAVARTLVRLAAGKAIEAATKSTKDKRVAGIGLLVSLIVQASMAAADVPDTRSWETLPSRVSVARVRLPAGAHEVLVAARGTVRAERVVLRRGGWAAVSVLSLR